MQCSVVLTYHHQPVDLELVEGLGQTEVVEGEEEGPEETDHHHRQEPVLAVRVGRGAADDAEKCQDLEIGSRLVILLETGNITAATLLFINQTAQANCKIL